MVMDISRPDDDDKPKKDEVEELNEEARDRATGVFSNPYTFPWWLVIMLALWVWVIYQMLADPDYLDAFDEIKNGIALTIWIAVASYFFALIIGLLTGVLRAYPPQEPDTNKSAWREFLEALVGLVNPKFYLIGTKHGGSERRKFGKLIHVILYNLVTLYIEFMRGIPPIVFLLIAGFIIVPIIRDPITSNIGVIWIPLYNEAILPVMNFLFDHNMSLPPPETTQISVGFTIDFVQNPNVMPYSRELYNDIMNGIFFTREPITEIIWRGRDPATAIGGLALVYGAFLSEVFRAGIQSVPNGQVEAAKSLGMSQFQTMQLVVVPQAVRNVLPPLGNNFISMIKDTALVTILGTSDITQEARRWSGSQFTYLETYSVLSLVYLTMTVTGSLVVQVVEKRLRKFAAR